MADVPDETAAAQVIEATLDDAGLAWESPAPGNYVVTLPGTRKLSTTCSLIVGKHSLSLNAFVVRHPDENDAGVHRWLLERNLRLFGVSYAIDPLGDVYLVGKLPLSVVTPEELDRLLGTVLEAADGAFNTLLELGFADSIRKEYEWRVSRGESTRNLDAFSHLIQRPSGGAS
ncbi:YbjN domain-containing protein [Streptomyces sp. C11-1]|uniref:YbjN domain-containing protein n=1 Tax=Streptomyces durocortorensis TaxID=2811104 RepID=A0ABY9VXR3_9ACTN|nr:YbjN domain-containing protein [Streptomyces durocortorensis]WNF28563.1 YbjN domain-containing protein [Streptomyces durocortorensis]